MGTSNFYYRNASKVYAVLMNNEVPVIDDEGNETDEVEYESPEQWECNDLIERVAEVMGENNNYSCNEIKEWDNSAPRSFPVQKIASWTMEKQYYGMSIEVILTATINSGYYEGACLDWMIQVYAAGNERDEIEADDLTYYGEGNAGLAKIIAPKANNWVNGMKERMIKDIEELFSEMCGMKLEVVATFSNGETMYKQAS